MQMQLSSSTPLLLHLFTWIIFFFSVFQFSFSADPRTSEAGLLCGQTRPPANANYVPLFTKEMDVLSQIVTAKNWGYHSESLPQISIYALAQCLGDLSHNDCLFCYAVSRTRLPHCLPSVSGRLYLDGCFLRYDSYNFANESVDPIRDATNCSSATGVVGDSQVFNFRRAVGELVDNVTFTAVSNGGYAVKGLNGVYGLAQCWKTLSKEGCRECLAKASKNVKGCVPSMEGRGLNAGCYLRYSTQKFYVDKADNHNTTKGASRTGRIVAVVCAVVAFCLLSLFAASATYRRIKRSKRERTNLGPILSIYNKSNLNFKYETLEKATKYFDDSRRLGQGGAGCVYKGILPNGKTVAVKRLFFSTRQWVDEFFNEINLISRIHHKNLVKLLGCSIEGPESLLVYEFVSNGSLDQYLFEKTRTSILSWKQRFNIIVGTAEAIAFLHGGTEMRIIHRDIKTSNVLLDEKFSAKVADFGLARLFGEDKTHLSTGIAGTLGYMAPEYIVRGQLTEKADVFSFGVLVLEIVCGKKNIATIEDNGSLPQNVWRLFKMEKLAEAVDPSLNKEFPEKEACRVLQVALLCTQASAALRPSMEQVIQMLNEKGHEIPEPNQPPFMNTGGSISSTSSTRSYNYSINSTTSAPNTTNKNEAFSYSSEESSTRQSSDVTATRREDLRTLLQG